MKERIRAVRKAVGLNQTDFGKALGASLSAASKWESGENAMSDATILLLCQKFRISENWLRTGAGEMRENQTREEEMGNAVGRLMADRPDSYKAAVVSTLLRFDPDGPEWSVQESVYKSIEAELKKE